MAARVFAVLLVGIVAAATLALVAADLDRRAADEAASSQRLADRLADTADLLGRAPSRLRPELVGVGPRAPRWLAGAPVAIVPDADLAGRLTARLGVSARVVAGRPTAGCDASAFPPPRPPVPPPRLGPETGAAPPPPAPPPPPPPPGGRPPDCRVAAFSLPDGARVVLYQPVPPRPSAPLLAGLGASPVFLAIVAFAAALIAYGVSALTTAPLSRLARAARALGDDLDRAPLRVEGPLEVREAAAAFNEMQARLRRGLAERTRMLAAISHDLQTPLTRLRLRLEGLDDPGLREGLLRDQRAMARLVREGLDLARLDHDAEPLETLDLGSLVRSLVDDAADLGEAVVAEALTRERVRTRTLSLSRCLMNLIDNAVKYGGGARLRTGRDADGAVWLTVSDRGPGIPEHRLAEVFEPFARLEGSRSRETGGVGLGLTLARDLAERARASLSLRNLEGGGLEARLAWPPETA